MEAVFVAPNIECAGCAASIQKVLGRQPGVQTVQVDVLAKTVQVGFDPGLASERQLAGALAEAGFPPAPREPR